MSRVAVELAFTVVVWLPVELLHSSHCCEILVEMWIHDQTLRGDRAASDFFCDNYTHVDPCRFVSFFTFAKKSLI